MNIAYRYRIYPTEEQKILLGKTFGCCRFLYNQMLNDKIQEYKKTKKMLKNTPAMYKKAYPFLKEVDSLALANVQLHLEKAYKNFFRDPKVGFPVESRTGLYSSDSTPFADQGVPALSFARDASRNVAPIHCRYDLKEVLSMEQLQK